MAGEVWHGEVEHGLVVCGWARQCVSSLGQARYGRHGKGGERMKDETLIDRIFQRIAVVEFHRLNGRWPASDEIILKDSHKEDNVKNRPA